MTAGRPRNDGTTTTTTTTERTDDAAFAADDDDDDVKKCSAEEEEEEQGGRTTAEEEETHGAGSSRKRTRGEGSTRGKPPRTNGGGGTSYVPDPAFEVEVDAGGSTPRSGTPFSEGAGGAGSEDGRSSREGENEYKKDYYAILGVDFDAGDSAVRSAYLKLALRNHPDKHGDTEEAKRKFQEISEAYHVLSDPGRRAEYDEAVEYSIDEFDLEEYLKRFHAFVLTSQGLSLGATTLDAGDAEVQDEIKRFLGFA